MRNARGLKAPYGALSVGIAVVKTRNCNGHLGSFSLLGRVNVALELHTHGCGGSALAGLASPDTVVVLLQFGDVVVAGLLDLRLGLSFGEAVATRNRSIRIVLTRA